MTEHYKDSIFSSFYYIFSKNHIEDYNDCIKLTDRLDLGNHNYNLGRFVIIINVSILSTDIRIFVHSIDSPFK